MQHFAKVVHLIVVKNFNHRVMTIVRSKIS